MEKIRRKIKIFWMEHSDPIIFYTLIVFCIIFIVQILNKVAIEKQKDNNTTTYNENSAVSNNSYSYNKKDKETIQEFIEYCKKNEIENAYSLISNECKENLYPTINDFINNYYNKRFNQNYDIQTKYKLKNTYEIYFYENALESGKIEDRDYIKDHYQIIEEKIYINTNIIQGE